MKLKKYIVAGLIGIVSLGSCTYLDKEPDTEIDIDMVFELSLIHISEPTRH